jgi:transposase
MINIRFSNDEVRALQHERLYHPHHRVRKKMDVLYLKSQKISHKDICRMVDITKPTLVSYLRDYCEGGIEKLKEINFYQPKSALEEYEALIENYFKQHPPATLAEAREKIENLTGINRSTSQVRIFLKRLGMKCRKTGSIPGKAVDEDKIEEQENFKKQDLEPRLEEAKVGKRIVFFVDAAHFVHGAFLATIWSFVRLFVPTPSCRKRVNILAALNAVTHEIVTIVNENYINSASVCQLLTKIKAINFTVPVTLVLDNARYQRCSLVQDTAASLNIELLFLPSYSPNLNLIERFWKFVKKQCLYSKYYSTFSDFKEAILNCVYTANKEHKKELASLFTLKFQSFKKVNVINT